VTRSVLLQHYRLFTNKPVLSTTGEPPAPVLSEAMAGIVANLVEQSEEEEEGLSVGMRRRLRWIDGQAPKNVGGGYIPISASVTLAACPIGLHHRECSGLGSCVEGYVSAQCRSRIETSPVQKTPLVSGPDGRGADADSATGRWGMYQERAMPTAHGGPSVPGMCRRRFSGEFSNHARKKLGNSCAEVT
jgi:hypothetical protein